MKKIVLPLFLFSFLYAAGQTLNSTGSATPGALDSVANVYYASQDKTLAIYNGRIFYGYPSIQEHAFYPENGWQTGSILYDGTWYHNISLMYDTHKEEVIVFHPSSVFIRLYSERVQEFNFSGIYFVRLLAGSNKILKPGFYQRLAIGDVTLFARRNKKIDEKIEGLAIERKFVASDQFFALKDGSYKRINNKKSLLNLVKDRRQNVMKHLRQKGLLYRRDKEKTIVETAEFYNQSRK
jgi:hypothetical protein